MHDRYGVTCDDRAIVPVAEAPSEPAMPPTHTGYPARDQTDAIAAGLQAIALKLQHLADTVAASIAVTTNTLARMDADSKERHQQALRRGRADR